MKFNPNAKLDPSQVIDYRPANNMRPAAWMTQDVGMAMGSNYANIARRYAARGAGGSPVGGTPAKDKSSAPAVPKAPPVASRTKPGTVPRRTRGRQ